MFYFILHPLQWIDHTNADIVFKCERWDSNMYYVSWKDGDVKADTFYDTEEVTEAMAKGWWIVTDEHGNY